MTPRGPTFSVSVLCGDSGRQGSRSSGPGKFEIIAWRKDSWTGDTQIGRRSVPPCRPLYSFVQGTEVPPVQIDSHPSLLFFIRFFSIVTTGPGCPLPCSRKRTTTFEKHWSCDDGRDRNSYSQGSGSERVLDLSRWTPTSSIRRSDTEGRRRVLSPLLSFGKGVGQTIRLRVSREVPGYVRVRRDSVEETGCEEGIYLY